MELTTDTGEPAADATALPEGLQKFVTLLDGGRFELTLARAVKHGAEDVRTIAGTRPCMRHIRNWNMRDGTAGHYIDIFASCTGTPKVVIDQLDAADAMRAIGLTVFFLGDGLGTGPSSSPA